MSGSADKTLRLWDLETFTQIGNPLEGHSNMISWVSFSSDGRRIVSGGSDHAVRLWNVATGDQIEDPLIGLSGPVRAVAESSDGRFVLFRDWSERTSIWDHGSKAVVWNSEYPDAQNSMTGDEAESIIRSCGEDTAYLWPRSFPQFSPWLYFDHKNFSVLANNPGEPISLGNLPSNASAWKFNDVAKLLAAGMESGGVVICTLVEESM